MQQATTVRQYQVRRLRLWTRQRYVMMLDLKTRQGSILSTGSASCASVFEIPPDYIEACHGAATHLANSLFHRGRVFYSTVVFWVARVKPSPCRNHRLLGEQRGEEIFRPLPEFEALVGMQDQRLNECLCLLTTRFPDGFEGRAAFCR